MSYLWPKSPCTQMVRPGGAILGRKSFKEGVSPEVIGRMEAATAFIVPHQNP